MCASFEQRMVTKSICSGAFATPHDATRRDVRRTIGIHIVYLPASRISSHVIVFEQNARQRIVPLYVTYEHRYDVEIAIV